MSIDDLLSELQKEYIESIPAKIQEISTFITSSDVEGLINSFHKLKGSGKTYGVEEISILGQFFEQWLRQGGVNIISYTTSSISILERIFQSRLQKKPYDINQDSDFQNIQKVKST